MRGRTYRYCEKAPLYAFGHGLSYTGFDYARLRITPVHTAAGETVTIAVDVTNAGAVAGDEVVQLYTHTLHASVTRPVKELRGFMRLTLQPGETRTVTFELAVNQLAYYGRDMRLVVEPGPVDIMIGASSDDIRLSGRIEITGDTARVAKTFFSQASVR